MQRRKKCRHGGSFFLSSLHNETAKKKLVRILQYQPCMNKKITITFRSDANYQAFYIFQVRKVAWVTILLTPLINMSHHV